MFRKKSRIFSLKDMGNGYRGYCFMYRGIQVAVLPKSALAGENPEDMVCLACIRAKSNFENSAIDYPNGFSDRNLFRQRQALSTTSFLCVVTVQRKLQENAL